MKISLNFKSKKSKPDLSLVAERAKKWIENNTIDDSGITVASDNGEVIYPEVSGYYIPTLIRIGDFDRAKKYGNYLLSIQNEDGSWNDPSGKTPYTFDTAQILKGLCALIENHMDENDKCKIALLRGCDYILGMQREDGSIATSDYSCWELPYGKRVPESIHVYCFEPLKFAAKEYDEKYEKCVKRALSFYLSWENLTDFDTLSHFNAYIIEGLIDMGERVRAKRAMDLIALHQRFDGSVPAYSNVNFVCSTGLFQYAICWYKLGEKDRANKAFNYACSLQNKTGGWFGSYGEEANYFPRSEISWAVKYFFDAMHFGGKGESERKK